MSKREELELCKEFINSVEWTFSKSMPQWPHEYTLATKKNRDLFDHFLQCIEDYGYKDKWGSRNDSYLIIGKYKYWGWDIPPIINRAEPISNQEMRLRGQKFLNNKKKKNGSK